jgi:arginyl-tRNA synthetase
MSSREGNVVFADDLLDEIKGKVFEIMKERLSGEDKDAIAETIAHGAVVYEMLKAGRTRDIAFDMEAALSFEGDSGPYLQYAHTRALSVLRKAKDAGIEADVSVEQNDLARKLYRLPEVIEESLKLQAPQQLVTYLTDLASTFNNFYAHNQIVVANDPLSGKRVALVSAFAMVMKNGLETLGIGVPDRM